MNIIDPINGGKVRLDLEMENDAEYYRVPQYIVQNIKENFGLSKLTINDIHVTCVKNSFHVTMEIRRISYHIGIRPNSDNFETEFWPINGSPDYLKTYLENIFNALYYIYTSILNTNLTISFTCGTMNLERIKDKFKRKPKSAYLNILMSPSKTSPPPRPLRINAVFSSEKKPNSISPKVAIRRFNVRGGGKKLIFDENDENAEPLQFGFKKAKTKLNLIKQHIKFLTSFLKFT